MKIFSICRFQESEIFQYYSTGVNKILEVIFQFSYKLPPGLLKVFMSVSGPQLENIH